MYLRKSYIFLYISCLVLIVKALFSLGLDGVVYQMSEILLLYIYCDINTLSLCDDPDNVFLVQVACFMQLNRQDITIIRRPSEHVFKDPHQLLIHILDIIDLFFVPQVNKMLNLNERKLSRNNY